MTGAAPTTLSTGLRLVGPASGAIFTVAKVFAFDDGIERAELAADECTITMHTADLLNPAIGWTVAPAEVAP